jgi:predicted PurR-regulated permease PerM
MENNSTQSKAARPLVTAAAFVIVVAGMRAAESLLVPFLLAAFISIICSPLLLWLQSRKIPAILSLAIVILIIAAIGFGIVVVVGSSLTDFTDNLPYYQAQLQKQTEPLVTWLSGFGIDFSDQLIRDNFSLGSIMQMVGKLMAGIGNVLTNAFLILLTVIFMLLEAYQIPSKMQAAFGKKDTTFPNLAHWLNNVKRYMAIKAIVSLATGILIAIWLTILGVDYPILWGLLAFLLNFVPNIGSIIAAIPAVLLAFIQFGFGQALLVAIGYVVVNIVIGSFVEPKFMGRGLGLSTLIVFISLVFWGWILGPVGMLLSVPLTVTVKIALQSNEDTKWLAILLDSETPETG